MGRPAGLSCQLPLPEAEGPLGEPPPPTERRLAQSAPPRRLNLRLPVPPPRPSRGRHYLSVAVAIGHLQDHEHDGDHRATQATRWEGGIHQTLTQPGAKK